MAKINREVKDRLFKRVFNNKKDLLELYNALNNSDYDDPEMLEINTIEDIIYMGMKNDLSFIIGTTLGIYEHQSSFNPNMPLRSLFYITDVFEGIIGDDRDIYSRRLIKIPEPQPIIFYNGVEDRPEREELLLSDAYYKHEGEHSLELKVVMLNINKGHNAELMQKCKKLDEYATFVSLVREYGKKYGSIELATNRAVDECIRNNILRDILSKNRSEVCMDVLREYDEEFHIKCEREIAIEEGIEQGREEGREEGRRFRKLVKCLSEQGRTEDIVKAAEDDEFCKKLMRELEIE